MQDFNSMINSVSSIFSTINSVISEMNDGDRYQLKELASIVSDRSGVQIEDSAHFVQYFTRNTNMGYVSRGKGGGFIRGSKQDKKKIQAKKQTIVNEESIDIQNMIDSL